MRPAFVRRALLGLAPVLVLATASPASAQAPKPITDCSEAGVRAAASAGGSHVFACDGSFSVEAPIVVNGNFSLDGGGRSVTLANTYSTNRQVFQIMAGTVRLAGFTVGGGTTRKLLDGGSADGEAGSPGKDAVRGRSATTAGASGGDAVPAGAGGPAKTVGADVQGGAIHIGAGARVTLSRIVVSGGRVIGGGGGIGGRGGLAAPGGSGASGGDGAAMGSGGDGSRAGHGLGGAVYNAGTLTVEDSAFNYNIAGGGAGGGGGNSGGNGPSGGSGGSGSSGVGGAGGDGSRGGAGADGGDGLGGAIYNSGELTVLRSEFTGNTAQGGHAGGGAIGGHGGRGGSGSYGGRGGNGGAGGSPADGGDGSGGAIYSTTPITENGNAFNRNVAHFGQGSRLLRLPDMDGGTGVGGLGGAGGGSGTGKPPGANGNNGADSTPGKDGTAGCGDLSTPPAGGAPSGCGCRLNQVVFGFKLEGQCPPEDGLRNGMKGVTITAPSGWQLSMPNNNPTDYALPLETTGALRLPVVLPDLSLTAGGLSVGAYENTLDDDGLRIGSGWFDVPRFKARGLVEDLHVGEGFKGSAALVELDLFDAVSLGATDVQFSPQGLKAGGFEIGLPGLLGGAAVSGRDLEVGPGGVSGQLTGAELAIGDMTARFEEARLTPNGISIGSADLTLPPYLGNAKLQAKNLTWDSTTHQLGIESARGEVDFTVAGRARLKGMVDFAFKPGGGYTLGGDVSLRIGDAEKPSFEADAGIKVESIDCDPAPGPCSNAAFLQEAKLTITPGKRVPLGQTGLALTSLGGFVKSSPNEAPNNHRRDADETIQGVSYTFGLKAGLATLADNGFAFTGDINATASTNGNFAIGFRDATIFRYIRAHGDICARLVAEPDAVCDSLRHENLARRPGTGVFAEAAAEARVSYGGRLFTASADLRLEAIGSIVSAGGETYLNAAANGTVSAGAGGWLLPDIQGSGSLHAEIGRFVTPAGKGTLGVKGRVEATLHVRSVFGDRDESVRRAIFVDRNGKYTEEDVDGYTPAQPGSRRRLTAAARRSRTHAFAIPAGQRQTMVVVDADKGTPRLTLTAPGGMRIVAVARKGKDPAISVEPARGKKLDRKLAGRIFVVRSRVPGALSVYMPEPQSGRWSAKVDGVKAGSYRFHSAGNRPLPRLKITAPAKGKTLRATPAKPTVTLQGKLADAPKKAAVSVYASAEPCVKRGGELVPPAPGTQLAARVKVGKKGGWSLKWNTAGVTPGRYVPYAVLANGTGARVGDCSKGSVVVGDPGAAARRPPPARRKPAAPTGQPSSAAVEIHGELQGCKANATLNPGIATNPPEPEPASGLPVLYVDSETTPCIAANIVAAITGTDPFTNTSSVTVRRGERDYSPYPGGAPATLTYGRFSSAKPDRKLATRHRQEACGSDPFYNGHRPGPPDGTLNPKTGARHDGKLTGCDEYPYASSLEGGTGAIVRGVLPRENNIQGGELSAFLRRDGNAVKLAYDTGSSGRFHVCVKVSGKPPVGSCPSP